VLARAAGSGLAGARILMVEDNGLLASSIAMYLRSLGVVVVGPAPRLKDAVHLAETMEIDGAMLDIDLDGTMVWPAADVLARRGIPFLFATGYQASLVMEQRFRDRVVLNKPFSLTVLRKVLDQMLGVQH
jgi:CheY-like chemotaxis protein